MGRESLGAGRQDTLFVVQVLIGIEVAEAEAEAKGEASGEKNAGNPEAQMAAIRAEDAAPHRPSFLAV